MIKPKRVYEKPSDADGIRILVERLWPRGLSKEKAKIDIWMKEIAPSAELRKWFNHEPKKWPEFQQRYEAELKQKNDLAAELKEKARNEMVTFVFAAKDEERNSAVLLKRFLERN